jgi:hypothetical protein
VKEATMDLKREDGDSFAALLGQFSVEKVKHIVEHADFTNCGIRGMKDFMELVAAGVCILVQREAVKPKTWEDVAKGAIERLPVSIALLFAGVVVMRALGIDLKDVIQIFKGAG